MNSRLNEVQELNEAYASSDENYDDDYAYGYSYDGDDDAYEDWPEDDSSCFEELDDTSFSSTDKTQRSMRRRKTARAKRRFFETTEVVVKNLRARYLEADSNPHSFNKPSILAADRLIKTAKKMGMDI